MGKVRRDDLFRVTPISRSWGGDRGQPIDRYYIQSFLNTFAADIQGHVLEIGDDVYTVRFGGDRVTTSDVLHVEPGNPKATIVADLTRADHIPSDTFDCIICTQTLQLVFDMDSAIRCLHRILKPGGVMLLTVPGISQIARPEMNAWGDYWRFTTRSIRQLFELYFAEDQLHVESCGNVLSAVAFLHGLASEELEQEELDYHDPDYQVTVAVRAIKPDSDCS